jgi:glycosyltransferase involved in cell wall biosynthesis
MNSFVSIIIPCFNEEKFITTLLDNVLDQDYPKELTEVVILDGMSTDRTREMILRIAEKNPVIRLLENEKRYVPFALNKGIKASKGDIIVRMDAHTFYPSNYVSVLVKYLEELKADNVGAVLQNMPGNSSAQGLAISKVLASSFGVGNAKFRIGVKEICRVDTVPFGCYRRDVFDRIGYFDEELLRNQDDEFNARLLKKGGSIYLIPELVIRYFTRTSVRKLINMYYQYGLFKPLVSFKIGRPTTGRQLVPFLFVLFLIITTAGSLFSIQAAKILFAGMALYVAADIFFSLKLTLQSKQSRLILYIPWIFLLLHLSYGWGYMRGLIRFVIMKKRKSEIATNR